MQFLVAMILPFATCIGMTSITAYLWWPTLKSPWQFAVLALLVCLGMHRLLQVVAELVKKTTTFEGFIVARRDRPNFAQLAVETLTLEAAIVATLLVAIGVPVLVWLRNALPQAV